MAILDWGGGVCSWRNWGVGFWVRRLAKMEGLRYALIGAKGRVGVLGFDERRGGGIARLSFSSKMT